MNALDNRRLGFAGMAGLLLISVLFFGYRWRVQPQAEAAEGLQTLASIIRIDAQRSSFPGGASRLAQTKSIPELLGALQKAATDNGVTVQSVATNPADPKKLLLKVRGDYPGVMVLLARLETFQTSLEGFDFAQEGRSTNGTVAISFVDKRGAPSSLADELDKTVKTTVVRNPFDRVRPASAAPEPIAGGLSSIHRLTSIWDVGAERVATIDGRDYRPGEKLQGMRIIAIDPAGVRLQAPNNPLVKHLYFRGHFGGPADD